VQTLRPGHKRFGLAIFMGALLCAGAAEAGGPLDLYYERSLMAAAGARCGLFSAEIGAALAASAAQARNAALRAGRAEAQVEAVGGEATARARSTSCGSPDLAVAASRVRGAFEGWSRTTRVSYPGAGGGWTADRTVYRSPSWRLVEAAPGGAAFGIAGDLQSPAALAAVLANGEAPYAARLKFRDPALDAQPWLAGPARAALPPRSVLRTVFAEAEGPAGPGLSQGVRSATAFRFPASAAAELAALDPRERFEVEFLLPGGAVRTAVFEVGDFAAGRAFLAMGER
jgi:hypothetical protein